jgi:hypothetical protein
MFKQIKTAEDIAAEAEAKARGARIVELKAFLAETDYKVLPDYDKPDDTIVDQRQAWRDEIRALETK